MRLFALIALLVPALALGAEASYTEGEAFEALPVPVQTGVTDAVKVTEFFSYACVHCFNFDPVIRRWRESQGEGVVFDRVPAVFNESWKLYAQAYYAAEACGVLEQTHTPLFNAVHAEGRRFASVEEIAGFYAGVVDADDAERCSSEEDFLRVFDSFAVRASVQQAIARGRAYRANGVPTMIVAGRWRVDGRMAGSNEAMLDVVDFLVAREQAESATPPAAREASAGGS